MAETAWLTNNANGTQKTGDHAPPGKTLVGLKVREQSGYGVIDVAPIYSSLAEWKPQPEAWITENVDFTREETIQADVNFFVSWVVAREQSGYGVVDIRLFSTNLAGTAGRWTSWALKNANGSPRTFEEPLPNNNGLTGVSVREQGGYGVVDLKFEYTVAPWFESK